MANRKGKLFVVSGTSGAGKTSVVTEALNRVGKEYNLSRIITYTSRPARPGEVDKKDYVFISGDEFKQKMANGFFLETTDYLGHLKGSPMPSKQDMELGKSFVLIVDLEGAKKAVKEIDEGLSVWIETSDLKVLKQRLEKRGTENGSQIEKRLALAEQEMKEAHKIRIFDYTLVNNEFDQAVNEFILLIKKAFE